MRGDGPTATASRPAPHQAPRTFLVVEGVALACAVDTLVGVRGGTVRHMRWLVIAALGLVALLGAVSPAAPQRPLAEACVGARVHYEQAPKPRLSIRLPWIAAGRQGRKVIGHLFYYGEPLRQQSGGRLTIYTGGELPGGGSTKILWIVRPLFSSQVIISGRQLDGPGTFEQWERSASSSTGTVFPSIVDVPSAGCWLLTVRNGRLAGRFAVTAIDAPSPSP